MYLTCLDLEGVLIPEIWIEFAKARHIDELLITRIFTKIRVETSEEVKGLDLGEHNEDAYPAFEYHTED